MKRNRKIAVLLLAMAMIITMLPITAFANALENVPEIGVRSDGNGAVTISKVVEGEGANENEEFKFYIEINNENITGNFGGILMERGKGTFDLKHGESKTLSGIPVSQGYTAYTITETDSKGYTVYVNGGSGATASGTMIAEGTVEVKFTNKKENGDFGGLKVSKTVEGSGADVNKEFKFNVILNNTDISKAYGDMTFNNGVAEFVLKHGQSKTATGLPVGVEYTVEESGNEGYTVKVNGTNETAATGSIEKGIVKDVNFENHKDNSNEESGGLIVKKVLKGSDININKEFKFKVILDNTDISKAYGDMTFTNGVAEFVLKDGQSKTATGLPAGVGYTVTELHDGEYKVFVNKSPGNTANGTIVKGEEQEVEFTNVKEKLVDFTVRKIISGTGASADKEFTFKLSVTDELALGKLNGNYGGMNFANGVASFKLKGGESKTAKLPFGYFFHIEESDNEGYKVTVGGKKQNTFMGNTAENKEVVFYNHKDAPEGGNTDEPGDSTGEIVKPLPETPGTIDHEIIYGEERIETAIKLSKRFFEKAKNVVVVRHDLFPDSLTASVLAKAVDGPILLTPSNKLDHRVKEEMERLGATKAYIVGGETSITPETAEQIKALTGETERIGGYDRYETSALLAKKVVSLVGEKGTSVIASGVVYPDALAISSFAAYNGYPILLVNQNVIPKVITDAFEELSITKTFLVGGENTITKSVEEALPGVEMRLAGANRYETAVEIAKNLHSGAKMGFIASGEVFADALVVGPVAAISNSPVLLTTGTTASQVTNDYIKSAGFTKLIFVGGPNTISSEVIKRLVTK